MVQEDNAMAEAITLELSDEVARHAREAARRTGRRMEDVLTDWISRGAIRDDTTLLVPGATYALYTPYGNEAAAQGLLDALKAEGAGTHVTDRER
jgi:hypothetical protein